MWPFGKSIADRVKDALKELRITQNLDLDVRERGGVVSFAGEVPNERYLRLLETVAMGVNGVKSVDTGGVVFAASAPEPEAATAELIKEAETSSAIAKAVYNNIRANGELEDDPIDVLQKGTGVILRGAVDSQHEYNLAVQLAQGTPGVGEVDASGLKVVEGAKQKAKAEAGYVNVPDEWYTVQPGDTLSEIALKFYGDGTRESYMKIARANGIENPDLIRVGQRLQIPR